MTSRKRVAACLEHRRPDRVPLNGRFRPEVWKRLREHFQIEADEEIRDRLGIDLRIVDMKESEEFRARAIRNPDGKLMIHHDDGSFESEWGVRFRFSRNSNYYGYVFCPLSDESNLSTYKFPNLDAPGCFEGTDREVKKLKKDYFVMAGVPTIFRHGWDLRGLEQWYEDLLLNERFVEKLSDRLLEYKLEKIRRFAQMGVDIIIVGGDIAMKDNLMMSPDVWRKFFKVREAKLLEEGRRFGVKHFFFHSDGNLMPVLEELIEIGFDIIDPIQPECMHPHEVKRLYGERMTLHGTISSQKTLPFGTAEDVRAEVRNRITTLGADGGLILAPTNVVQYDVPLENILALYDTAREMTI